MDAVKILSEMAAEGIYRRSIYLLVTLEDPADVPSPVRGATVAAEDWLASAGYFHNVYRDWWEVPKHGETRAAFCERIRADVLPCAAPKGGSS